MDTMTIQEVMTAYRVGYQTIYRAVQRGELEAYKPGRKLIIDAESAGNWFKSKKIKPKAALGRPRKQRGQQA